MIQFKNVSKKYPDGTYATRSLNFAIQEGEFFVLIGPSGCGKTTTLKLINRLIDLTDGTIFFNGKKISEYDIHELRWNIGYVLQQIALFPHMTIEENIAVVPELKKWSREKIRSRVDELLEMVGLEPDTYRDRKPSELSGGQQQRVGVVRALAADPQIILMDEPFSALDPISREKIQNDLIDLQKRIKKTIVFVTHDMQEALKLGDRICLMNEGEIVQIDTPEMMIERPANHFAEEFIGNGATQMMGTVKVEKITRPHLNENVASLTTISADTPIHDVLSLLVNEEMVAVEKNGAALGVVTREAALQYMSENMKERRG